MLVTHLRGMGKNRQIYRFEQKLERNQYICCRLQRTFKKLLHIAIKIGKVDAAMETKYIHNIVLLSYSAFFSDINI